MAALTSEPIITINNNIDTNTETKRCIDFNIIMFTIHFFKFKWSIPLKTTKKPVLELPRRRVVRAQASTIPPPRRQPGYQTCGPVALRPRVAPGLPLSERYPMHVKDRLAKRKSQGQEKKYKKMSGGFFFYGQNLSRPWQMG